MKIENKYSEGLSGINIHLSIAEVNVLKQMVNSTIDKLKVNDKSLYPKIHKDDYDTTLDILIWLSKLVEVGESQDDALKSLGFKSDEVTEIEELF